MDEPDTPLAVIVTAIQPEIEAVTQHLNNPREAVDSRGTVYDCGEFLANGRAWRIAVAQCGQGNVSAADLVHLASNHFNPDVLMFVGVAGSLKDDVKLGDVVASTQVYHYHSGKAEEELRPRPKLAFPSRVLEQRALATVRRKKWQERIPSSLESKNKLPGGHTGAIAAGEQVVADERSDAYHLIRNNYSDALAVEMEGYGALHAAHSLGVGAIVVRGISDNVVDKSECDADGWQPEAAAHASAFAFEMLANLDIGPLARRVPTNFPSDPNTPGDHTQPPSSGLERQDRSVQIGKDVDGSIVVTGSHNTITYPSDSVGVGTDIRSEIPTVDELLGLFKRASQDLLDWPTELDDGKWILRPELRQLQDFTRATESGVAVLLGEPGSGKSALLARLGNACVEDGIAVLAVKADVMPATIDDADGLAGFLKLPVLPAECVERVAADRAIVVLIDQLDALADLVDLKSGRLNVLLNLVKRLRNSQNVRIVCSCREFEYRHDTRLEQLDADAIQLELPEWDQVAEILSDRSIDATTWPKECQRVLRYPQHLKVFLRRLDDTSEAAIFRNYRQLYDDLWSRKITNFGGTSERSTLIHEIAAFMAKEETPWAPVARFEDREKTIAELIAEGILVRPGDGPRVGFQHQTLFDHARARSFASGHGSLAEYALERQDSLFARPITWATIGYLRDASPTDYRREMTTFFESELRLHLRYLLIEFLGQNRAPEEFEVELLVNNLEQPRFRPKVLSAICGNEDWFRALVNHFPPLMQLSEDECWPMVRVITQAWPFARQQCLDLINGNWFPFPVRDSLTWRALKELEDWDESTVDMVCRILRRTDVASVYVTHLATTISSSSPELAPRVVAAALNRELEKLEAEAEPNPPPSPKDITETDAIANMWLHEPNRRFERLLEDTQGWYELPAVAEGSPKAFLEYIGPWFIRLMENLLQGKEPHHIIRRYREDHSLATDFNQESGRERPIPDALDMSVRDVAKQDSAAFLELTSGWEAVDSLTVQRLLARGYCQFGNAQPAKCLEFLLADPRRLFLGRARNAIYESRQLISAITPHLTNEQRDSLERSILSWSKYHPYVDMEDFRVEDDKHIQARLLSYMPFDDLSTDAQTRVREYEERFHLETDDDGDTGFSRIDSPVSAAQMESGTDEQILDVFNDLVDETGDTHPKDPTKGGSEQAAHELSEVAKRDPSRVAKLLPSFRTADQQRPVAYALKGLAESNYSTDELVSLILELDSVGFSSKEFRVEASQAFSKRTKRPTGLPDDVCLVLERWLSEQWDTTEGDWSEREDKDDEPRPILWGHRTGSPLPYGTYFTLHALTYGYLLREPAATECWLTMLESHLERPEVAATWRSLANDLRWLVNCDHTRAASILDKVFTRFPKARESVEGVVLLAHLWRLVPEDKLRAYLSEYRKSEWKLGSQAYGELLCLGALRPRGHEWASAQLEQDLSAPLESILTGVAFTTTRLWDQPDTRGKANELLVQLAKSDNSTVCEATTELFFLVDELPADTHTSTLLKTVLENTCLLQTRHVAYIIERIADFLPREPELVFQIAKQVIKSRGDEIRSIQYALAAAAGAFVNIALTLQRLGGDYRAKGLELFEQLMELGVNDAQSAIYELDKRPLSAPRSPRRRRRRRRHQKK